MTDPHADTRRRLVQQARGLWAGVVGLQAWPNGVAGAVSVVVAPQSRSCPPGWVGVVSIGNGALVAVPDAAVSATVTPVLEARGPEELFDLRFWNGAFAVRGVLGPARLAYAAGVPDVEAAEERVAPGDPALAALFGSVAPEEVDESGLAVPGSPVAVAVEREAAGRVVAAAAYRVWDGVAAHVGVLTAAEHRGRGAAGRVAAATTADALAAGLLPQWRARVPASLRVAARLGYVELGGQVSLRLG